VSELIIIGAISLIINVTLSTLAVFKVLALTEGKKKSKRVLSCIGAFVVVNILQRLFWMIVLG